MCRLSDKSYFWLSFRVIETITMIKTKRISQRMSSKKWQWIPYQTFITLADFLNQLSDDFSKRLSEIAGYFLNVVSATAGLDQHCAVWLYGPTFPHINNIYRNGTWLYFYFNLFQWEINLKRDVDGWFAQDFLTFRQLVVVGF